MKGLSPPAYVLSTKIFELRIPPWFLIIENKKGKKNCPKMSVGDGKRPSPAFHANGKLTHTVPVMVLLRPTVT
jgi:hypothetical protein